MMKQQQQVEEFHSAFGHPVRTTPTFLESDRAKARMSWVIEEVEEFLRADNVVDQADALSDALYFIVGTAIECGVDLEPIFDIVQNSNMGKLWEDGKPRYREDGKILKPPYWSERYAPEPKIKAEIEKQIKVARLFDQSENEDF